MLMERDSEHDSRWQVYENFGFSRPGRETLVRSWTSAIFTDSDKTEIYLRS